MEGTANRSSWRIATVLAWTWPGGTASAPSAFPPSARAYTAIRWKKRVVSRSKPLPCDCAARIVRCRMFCSFCLTRARIQCMRASRRRALLLQEVLDRLSGLPRPVLVLDESETHVALAERSESDARRYSNQRFFHQQLREFERAFGAMLLRDRRPDEHGALRRLHWPARAIQTG